MISKNVVLSDNYGDLMKFIVYKLEEPTYLDTCPKNATYISNTSVESSVDAMNFYFETKSLTESNDTRFISLYTVKAENSSHKECFSMFVTYFSQDTKELFI